MIRFRPSGNRPEFFEWYCSRITAAGWYGSVFPQDFEGLRFPAAAYLRGADFRNTHLQGEFLVYADLRGAILDGAQLQFSFLVGADLSDANLTDADAEGALLLEAVLIRTKFAGANLADAQLETAKVDPEALSEEQLAALWKKPGDASLNSLSAAEHRVQE